MFCSSVLRSSAGRRKRRPFRARRHPPAQRRRRLLRPLHLPRLPLRFRPPRRSDSGRTSRSAQRTSTRATPFTRKAQATRVPRVARARRCPPLHRFRRPPLRPRSRSSRCPHPRLRALRALRTLARVQGRALRSWIGVEPSLRLLPIGVLSSLQRVAPSHHSPRRRLASMAVRSSRSAVTPSRVIAVDAGRSIPPARQRHSFARSSRSATTRTSR